MMFSLINEPEKQQHSDTSQNNHKNNIQQCATNVNHSTTHSPIKYVINLFPNVRSQPQELAIDAMKSGL